MTSSSNYDTSYFDKKVLTNPKGFFYNDQLFRTNEHALRGHSLFKLGYNFEVNETVNIFNKENYIRVVPESQAQTVYNSGGTINFTLPDQFPGIHCEHFLDLQILNNHGANDAQVPSIPLTYQVKLLIGTTELATYNQDQQLLNCYKFINSKNKAYLTALYGINMVNGGGGLITLTHAVPYSYLIPLKTPISGVNFYKPQNLNLRIQIVFNNGISHDVGNVPNLNILVTKCDLICYIKELTSVSLNPLKSAKFLDYRLHSFFKNEYYQLSTTGLLQNKQYVIKLPSSSLAGLACNFMLLFIRKENPTVTEGVDSIVDSKLTTIAIKNNSGSSIYNSYNFDYNITNIELLSRFVGKYDCFYEYFNDYAAFKKIIFLPLGICDDG